MMKWGGPVVVGFGILMYFFNRSRSVP